MVNDTEPRYRLVDSNGNVVGSLFAEADGTLKLQEGTSGSDNEVSVATDGTFNAPAVSTDSLSLTPVLNNTATLSSGESIGSFGTINEPVGTPLVATAVANNDPGNDVAFSVSVFYDTSNDVYRASVTETKNDGGGEVKVVVWRIDV